MGRLTVGGTALDVTVLDSSSLSNPNRSVPHFPIGGGKPDVTVRASTGLSGTLELLCRDAATADAVYAAHLNGQVLTLDNWTRQNLATRWRTPFTVDAGQPGTPSLVETGGPVGQGWWQFVSSGPDSGSPFNLDYTPSGTGAIPVQAGATYTLSSYVRQDSADGGAPLMRVGATYYNAGGAGVGSTEQTPLSSVQGTFVRISRTFTIPVGVAFLRPTVSFSGSNTRPAGTIYYVVGVMLELGDRLGSYFNGSSADTTSTLYEWQGAPDLSSSLAYVRPALDFTYMCLEGAPEIPHRRGKHWLVRVSGIQEV